MDVLTSSQSSEPFGSIDANVGPVDRANTALGRLAIGLDLIRDENGLLSGGCKACWTGKFGDQISDPVMSSCAQSFGTTGCMSAIWGQDALALFAPGGVHPHLWSVPGAGYPRR